MGKGADLYILEMFNRKQQKLNEEREELYKKLDRNTEQLVELAESWEAAKVILCKSKLIKF